MNIIEQINTLARHKYGTLREACRVLKVDYADIQSDYTSFRYKETPEKFAILNIYLEIICEDSAPRLFKLNKELKTKRNYLVRNAK